MSMLCCSLDRGSRGTFVNSVKSFFSREKNPADEKLENFFNHSFINADLL